MKTRDDDDDHCRVAPARIHGKPPFPGTRRGARTQSARHRAEQPHGPCTMRTRARRGAPLEFLDVARRERGRRCGAPWRARWRRRRGAMPDSPRNGAVSRWLQARGVMPRRARRVSRTGLAGLTVVAFESRRATEMAELIAHHGGARGVRAVDARGAARRRTPDALALGGALLAGRSTCTSCLTGVGTRALLRARRASAARSSDVVARCSARTTIVARGPKPVAALRELGLVPRCRRAGAEHLARAARDARRALPGRRPPRRRAGVRRARTSSCWRRSRSAAPRCCACRSIAGRCRSTRAAPRGRRAARRRRRGRPRLHQREPGRRTSSSIAARGGRRAGVPRARSRAGVVASIGPTCSEALRALRAAGRPRADASEDGDAARSSWRRGRRRARARRSAARRGASSDAAATRPSTHGSRDSPFLRACRREPIAVHADLAHAPGGPLPAGVPRGPRATCRSSSSARRPSSPCEVTVEPVERSASTRRSSSPTSCSCCSSRWARSLAFVAGEGPVIANPVRETRGRASGSASSSPDALALRLRGGPRSRAPRSRPACR